MRRLDLTHIGGLPFSQNRLATIQQGYTEAFNAIAKLCGDKTILHGVQVSGGMVSSGWISYNGELIEFIGGSFAAQVVISESSTSFTYADNVARPVEYRKTATCGVTGAFPFSELMPLTVLSNIWLPGDIKEKVCSNDYIAANFDSLGYGINREKGWQILSQAYPDSAGRVFVNVDLSDPAIDTPGKFTGAKTATLTPSQQGSVEWAVQANAIGDSLGEASKYIDAIKIGDQSHSVATDPLHTWSTTLYSRLSNDAAPHSIMQPSFAVLKLIKL